MASPEPDKKKLTQLLQFMIGFFIVSVLVDAVATMHGIKSGYLVEIHPIMIECIKYWGPMAYLWSGLYRCLVAVLAILFINKLVSDSWRVIYYIYSITVLHMLLVGWHLGLWIYYKSLGVY